MKLKNSVKYIYIILFIGALYNCTSYTKTESVQDAGASVDMDDSWIVLFDGKEAKGWRAFNQDAFPPDWEVKDNSLHCLGNVEGTNDLVYDQSFSNFELTLDWKISEKGNSGIMYHVVEGEQYSVTYQTGPEYQLIDNEGYPERLGAKNIAGADYDMYAPDSINYLLNPAGDWNSTTIKYKDGSTEYWLNGEKTVSFQRNSSEWQGQHKRSKWVNFPDYAKFESGLIALQNHGNEVWFRNIRIREL